LGGGILNPQRLAAGLPTVGLMVAIRNLGCELLSLAKNFSRCYRLCKILEKILESITKTNWSPSFQTN
jgi:hypothetical protein